MPAHGVSRRVRLKMTMVGEDGCAPTAHIGELGVIAEWGVAVSRSTRCDRQRERVDGGTAIAAWRRRMGFVDHHEVAVHRLEGDAALPAFHEVDRRQ